jgi:hypothetical protein
MGKASPRVSVKRGAEMKLTPDDCRRGQAKGAEMKLERREEADKRPRVALAPAAGVRLGRAAV